MKHFLIYRVNTGEVTGIYGGPEGQAGLQAESGESIIEASFGMSDINAYVDLNTIAPRYKQSLGLAEPPPIVADGEDEAVIDNIPAGVSVTWPDGQTDEVTDGEVRFSVDLPGTYVLRFAAVEYLDKEVTIEAVAAD